MQNKRTNPFYTFWHSDKSLITCLYLLCAIPVSFTVFRIAFIQGKTVFAVFAALLSLAAVLALFVLLIKKTGASSVFAQKIRNGKAVWLSLLFAFVVSFFVFAVYTLSPFGNYTVLRMDLYHQYGPLFAELYDRVAEGKSLLYSWHSAGGSSFFGNFFNYLSSPFTCIISAYRQTSR